MSRYQPRHPRVTATAARRAEEKRQRKAQPWILKSFDQWMIYRLPGLALATWLLITGLGSQGAGYLAVVAPSDLEGWVGLLTRVVQG